MTKGAEDLPNLVNVHPNFLQAAITLQSKAIPSSAGSFDSGRETPRTAGDCIGMTKLGDRVTGMEPLLEG